MLNLVKGLFPNHNPPTELEVPQSTESDNSVPESPLTDEKKRVL